MPIFCLKLLLKSLFVGKKSDNVRQSLHLFLKFTSYSVLSKVSNALPILTWLSGLTNIMFFPHERGKRLFQYGVLYHV